VGSAVDLTKRLWGYFSIPFLKKELRRNRSRISNSLLKYGYSNFSLDVIEYCVLDKLIEREQYYLDLLNPEYNILKIAGSRLGSKHSPETLLKFKNRKLSAEALANLKKAKAGIAPLSPLRKINHLLATGHITTVVNKENDSVKFYDSIRAAARDLGTSHNTLLNCIKTNKLYKGIYLITKKTKDK
jgi:group I intron endonuclease